MDEWINQWVTKLFVEKPLALPWSAKYKDPLMGFYTPAGLASFISGLASFASILALLASILATLARKWSQSAHRWNQSAGGWSQSDDGRSQSTGKLSQSAGGFSQSGGGWGQSIMRIKPLPLVPLVFLFTQLFCCLQEFNHSCLDNLKSLQEIFLSGQTLLSVAVKPPEWSNFSWCSYFHMMRASDDPMC